MNLSKNVSEHYYIYSYTSLKLTSGRWRKKTDLKYHLIIVIYHRSFLDTIIG